MPRSSPPRLDLDADRLALVDVTGEDVNARHVPTERDRVASTAMDLRRDIVLARSSDLVRPELHRVDQRSSLPPLASGLG